MQRLSIDNPFNAPVYHEETVGSTMEVSRHLALRGEVHGTVITADSQEAGRGRIRGRSWSAEKGCTLPFTILLRYPRIEDIPQALTLRAGLAVALAVEEFAPGLAGQVMVKWPNDIMIVNAPGAKKLVGILAEADGSVVHIGIGVNVAQRQFPEFLRDKATSISLAENREIAAGERFVLLEKILACLYRELEAAGENGADWKSRIEARLYRKGEQVSFAKGAADSGNIVNGMLAGIGSGGELLIMGDHGLGAFLTGELLAAYPSCHKQSQGVR